MGVINCTPDSYFEPSRKTSVGSAVETVGLWVEKNAIDIVDVGGESTRPQTWYEKSNTEFTPEIEWERVSPILNGLREHFPKIPLSIDTRSSYVARKSLDVGVQYVNLITNSMQIEKQSEMIKVLNLYSNCKLILTHMHGETPATMQQGPFLADPIMPQLLKWFEIQIKVLLENGINSQRIIIDPGICFGKNNPNQNLEILQHLPELKKIGYELLIGISRKSFLSSILSPHTKLKSNDLLHATLGLSSFLFESGVDIIRVHDVLEHKDALEVWWAIHSYKKV